MENNLKLSALKFLLLGVLPCQMASAYIEVSPLVTYLDKKSGKVTIRNIGDQSEYVTLKLFKVNNPGVALQDESRQDVGEIKSPDLYVTPFKFTLGPRQSKTATVSVLRTPKQEQVYRLVVLPEVNLNSESVKKTDETGQMLLNVNLGFEALIRHLPKKQTESWAYQCTTRGIELKATGTVRVEFTDMTSDGKKLDSFNVYPETAKLIESKTLSGKAISKKIEIKC